MQTIKNNKYRYRNDAILKGGKITAALKRNLWQIIQLRNIIQKYLVFLSLFGSQIGLKQASLFILHTKQVPFC